MIAQISDFSLHVWVSKLGICVLAHLEVTGDKIVWNIKNWRSKSYALMIAPWSKTRPNTWKYEIWHFYQNQKHYKSF